MPSIIGLYFTEVYVFIRKIYRKLKLSPLRYADSIIVEYFVDSFHGYCIIIIIIGFQTNFAAVATL